MKDNLSLQNMKYKILGTCVEFGGGKIIFKQGTLIVTQDLMSSYVRTEYMGGPKKVEYTNFGVGKNKYIRYHGPTSSDVLRYTP